MKKSNPADSTLRNTQAANKKLTALKAENKVLKARVTALEKRVKKLEYWIETP